MTPRRRWLPWLSLLLIYLFWGSTYLAIRILVRDMPPMAGAALRFAIAGVLMAGLSLLVHRGQRWPTRRQLLHYSAIGILLLAVGNAFVMWAEQRIPSGIAALIGGTVPLWLALLDGLRPGGQRWTARVFMGGFVGLVGVLLVARPDGHLAPGHWQAMAVMQIAAVAWTVGSLYAQAVPDRLPLFTAAAVEMLAAVPVLLVESRLIGEDLTRFAIVSTGSWWALGYLVMFGSLVGFTAFAYCLNELPASTVGTYAYVNPIVAVVLGRLILGEPLSPGLLVGGALIVVSVIVTTRPRREERPPVASAAPARVLGEPESQPDGETRPGLTEAQPRPDGRRASAGRKAQPAAQYKR